MQWTVFDKAIAAFVAAFVAKGIVLANTTLGINLPLPDPSFESWLNMFVDAAVNGLVAYVMVYFAKNKPA